MNARQLAISLGFGFRRKTAAPVAEEVTTGGGGASPRVTIIGTGLIGASIALGLKAKGPKGLVIVGSDRSRDNAKAAEQMHAVDIVDGNPARAVVGAGLVIIATPILSIREVMEDIAHALEPGAVVTDTGSTKADIARWAAEILPEHVAFVGGHPMAGKTDAGPKAAEGTLFNGARWVITPPKNVPSGAVDVVLGLANVLGATPQFMDPEEHDAYVAAISHLPLMAVTAMFRMVRASEAWPEMSLLASSGFRDTTRLAGTDSAMAHDIAITNRVQIVHWLQRYREAIRDLETEIMDVEREPELFRILSEANMQYSAYREGVVGRREVDDDVVANLPDAGMMDLIMGGALAERAREMQRRSEERLEEREREFRSGGRG